MYKRFLSAALAVGLALTCLGGPNGGARPSTEPANLETHKDDLRDYINSGGYANDVAAVALSANQYLVKRIARGPAPGRKMAVVFDIDETTLSNLPEMLSSDFGYIPRIWDAWIRQAQARAIVPVQIVYDTAVRAKVDVFFITGRPDNVRASTERNLRDVGYDTWTQIFYKPASDPTLTTAAFKIDTRRQLTRQGYDIILNLGDQDSDLRGGYAETVFKLPDPFYIIK